MKRFSRTNSGTVLIVAMWILLVLTGLALVYARTVRVELAGAANRVAAAQAEQIAKSALQYVIAQVDGTEGNYDASAASFEAVSVGGGYFWVILPSLEGADVRDFGLRDEAACVNLNSANEEMLLRIPGMTAELAASIIDWRDPDDEITAGGAESQYYVLLENPYYAKNAPFETVEESLLVKDADEVLLFGEDMNRNGYLDANEDDGDDSEPADNSDGHLDQGLWRFATVCSMEPNTDVDGEARANVNDANAEGLSTLLREFLPEERYLEVLGRARSGRPFQNVLDFYFRSGLEIDEFYELADYLTTGTQEMLPGLINVNTAPKETLLCLPGLDDADVTSMIAKRQSSGVSLNSIAWVAEALPEEKAVGIGQFITTRSWQFSADIVAVSGDGRAFRRYRAVLDTRSRPPRVIEWNDLTRLGWPLDQELLTTLKSGGELTPSIVTVAGGAQ